MTDIADTTATTDNADEPAVYRPKKRKFKPKRIGFWFLIFLIAVFLLFPFYWAINSSLKSEPQLRMTPGTFIPRNPDTNGIDIYWRNYKAVFQNEDFLWSLWNSAIVATCVTVLALVIGSFAGFALGKLRFRGRTPSLYLILAMTMFPQIAILSGLYELRDLVGLSARPSMIITYMLFTLPFTVWVLTTFMRDLPVEIEEAAIVDGATPWVIITKVFMPLLWPALVTTGLLAFIQAWNEFLFALTFTISQDQRTVPVAIALLSGASAQEIPWGPIMAASVTVTVPLIILVLIFQRKIVAGLTAGGVKG